MESQKKQTVSQMRTNVGTNSSAIALTDPRTDPSCADGLQRGPVSMTSMRTMTQRMAMANSSATLTLESSNSSTLKNSSVASGSMMTTGTNGGGLKFHVELSGRTCSTEEEILSVSMLQQLRPSMPLRFRLFPEYQLLYSSAQHGFSLNTLYSLSTAAFSQASPSLGFRTAVSGTTSRHGPSLPAFSTSFPGPSGLAGLRATTRPASMPGSARPLARGVKTAAAKVLGPCLLVLRSADGAIFGAYLSDHVRPTMNHYGSFDCFLWKLDPRGAGSGLVRTFPATGANNFFIISEPSFLAVGCSDGKFGLWLDAELFTGQSNVVATFNNDILANHCEFQIAGIELWALVE